MESECPSEWKFFRNHCFVFESDEKTWDDAEGYCTDHDGHLASFHDENEYKFIRELILTASGTNTKSWVGGTKGQNDEWKWTDGSIFSYTHWGEGEPNNAGGHENCMDMNWNGQNYVNDEVCSQKNAFVCAKEA
ncbi:ladderlectin-like [Nematolebias whitei]|uniref:ladderlectin-like n=1 Tax=Nematolebias whitei TaxID=451745 RepID=UPI00189B9CC7|nr:ladderlectin-like [Nematolebias whitei]